ncbi:MBL fold metallo-hydrolase [Halomonas sp. B23F22_10]|uniref:MBL fold metallo-hydrolase n=1 Tax=Halomonas sp. B23F22_10 TaxID=3459515 RepID=UPI00373E6A66
MKNLLNSCLVLLAFFCVSDTIIAQQKEHDSNSNVSFVTLGTGGGPIIREQRSESANAILVNGQTYLFDTGSGTERQMVKSGIPMESVQAIFLSHHHVDHNADLGQLITSRWVFNHTTSLPIIGPPGTVNMVENLTKAFYATEMAPIGTSNSVHKPPLADTVNPQDLASNMTEPTEVYRDSNIRVLAITNQHYHFPQNSAEAKYSRSYAYRIETPQRSYVYTGDTGPSENVIELAHGADVLVSEVIDLNRMSRVLRHAKDIPEEALQPMIQHMQENHLTPEEVGKMAAEAGVGQVVLTHIAPGLDGETGLSSYTRGVSELFEGPVTLAEDLDRY